MLPDAIQKIVGFGDSFVLGNELQGDPDGSCAWPGLIAARLGREYQTLAVAGCGNEHIAQQIFQYFAHNPTSNVLAVVNWTWALRWDINLTSADTWVGLGPTCVPDKLTSLVTKAEAQRLIDFYQFYAANNAVWNQQRSLMAIYAVQSFFKDHAITNIQTYMDRSIWFLTQDRIEHYDAIRADSWPIVKTHKDLDNLPCHIAEEVQNRYEQMQPPPYIRHLQRLTWPQMQSFDGLDFLSWSQQRNYPITELLHPLEPAHHAAADYWFESYKSLCR